jgi:histidyl-tRNA synthetase
MPALQPARGTQDLLPEAARRHRRVSETAREIAALYGFAEIATPIFEFTEVFARPIGEHTDIVSKEMYTFTDRGGEELTLRPENTAGVVRAVLSNGLTQTLPLKFFYSGPMFRYERPQKGRFRQFHQIGVELLGVATPQADIEVIALGYRVLKELGIADRVVLELSSLGDRESRAAFRENLVGFFDAHRDHLSEDSRRRIEANPLRILDSKDPADQEFINEWEAGVLRVLDSKDQADQGVITAWKVLEKLGPYYSMGLNDKSGTFFDSVRRGLDSLGIPYQFKPRLVRGLDYYTHTVFEFVTTDLGAQGTVLAGGRYDGLVELMGGKSMPGVGWAAGIERLAMMIADPPASTRPIAVIPMGDAAEELSVKLAEQLRDFGFTVELGYSGKLQRRLARANRLKARAAVIIGDEEIALNSVSLLDMDGHEQEIVPLADLTARLKALVG